MATNNRTSKPAPTKMVSPVLRPQDSSLAGIQRQEKAKPSLRMPISGTLAHLGQSLGNLGNKVRKEEEIAAEQWLALQTAGKDYEEIKDQQEKIVNDLVKKGQLPEGIHPFAIFRLKEAVGRAFMPDYERNLFNNAHKFYRIDSNPSDLERAPDFANNLFNSEAPVDPISRRAASQLLPNILHRWTQHVDAERNKWNIQQARINRQSELDNIVTGSLEGSLPTFQVDGTYNQDFHNKYIQQNGLTAVDTENNPIHSESRRRRMSYFSWQLTELADRIYKDNGSSGRDDIKAYLSSFVRAEANLIKEMGSVESSIEEASKRQDNLTRFITRIELTKAGPLAFGSDARFMTALKTASIDSNGSLTDQKTYGKGTQNQRDREVIYAAMDRLQKGLENQDRPTDQSVEIADLVKALPEDLSPEQLQRITYDVGPDFLKKYNQNKATLSTAQIGAIAKIANDPSLTFQGKFEEVEGYLKAEFSSNPEVVPALLARALSTIRKGNTETTLNKGTLDAQGYLYILDDKDNSNAITTAFKDYFDYIGDKSPLNENNLGHSISSSLPRRITDSMRHQINAVMSRIRADGGTQDEIMAAGIAKHNEYMENLNEAFTKTDDIYVANREKLKQLGVPDDLITKIVTAQQILTASKNQVLPEQEPEDTIALTSLTPTRSELDVSGITEPKDPLQGGVYQSLLRKDSSGITAVLTKHFYGGKVSGQTPLEEKLLVLANTAKVNPTFFGQMKRWQQGLWVPENMVPAVRKNYGSQAAVSGILTYTTVGATDLTTSHLPADPKQKPDYLRVSTWGYRTDQWSLRTVMPSSFRDLNSLWNKDIHLSILPDDIVTERTKASLGENDTISLEKVLGPLPTSVKEAAKKVKKHFPSGLFELTPEYVAFGTQGLYKVPRSMDMTPESGEKNRHRSKFTPKELNIIYDTQTPDMELTTAYIRQLRVGALAHDIELLKETGGITRHGVNISKFKVLTEPRETAYYTDHDKFLESAKNLASILESTEEGIPANSLISNDKTRNLECVKAYSTYLEVCGWSNTPTIPFANFMKRQTYDIGTLVGGSLTEYGAIIPRIIDFTSPSQVSRQSNDNE